MIKNREINRRIRVLISNTSVQRPSISVIAGQRTYFIK